MVCRADANYSRLKYPRLKRRRACARRGCGEGKFVAARLSIHATY